MMKKKVVSEGLGENLLSEKGYNGVYSTIRQIVYIQRTFSTHSLHIVSSEDHIKISRTPEFQQKTQGNLSNFKAYCPVSTEKTVTSNISGTQ